MLRTDGRTDAHTDVKTVYPPQTKFAGSIKNKNKKKIQMNTKGKKSHKLKCVSGMHNE